MCGIAGVVAPGETPRPELVRAMADALRHRGPDGEGIYVAPSVGLGMRRLAVIDLVTGDQPMGTLDGGVQVVFNGEIYNHRELRRLLEPKGYAFRTSSDTEVLPYLYDAYGKAFLQKLNGMFALAVWDAPRRQLLLARDRTGIKPLYYAVRGDRLLFASEVKALLAVEPDLGPIDPLGLHQFLSLEYTLTPHTLFRDVHKLPAGGWLTWHDGTVKLGRFWQIPADEPDYTLTADVASEQLRETLFEAVRRQLVSDVPLGAFLSGGIDSSILVAAMSHVSDATPRTFSVGFGEASYDELAHAALVARTFGTEHHEERLEPNYLEHLDTVVAHLDQPIADFSVFPTLLVSQMAREHVTVALAGDGGDELFCGYDTYEAQRIASRTTDHLPRAIRRGLLRAASLLPLSSGKRGPGNTLRRFLEGAQGDPSLEHLRWMTFLDADRRADLYTPDYAQTVGRTLEQALIDSLRPRRRDRALGNMASDVRGYLAENILPKIDLMSMAVSLEARVPYLDNDVIDLALRIPSRLKRRAGRRKWILKRAFDGIVPRSILRRGKEGFSIPLKNWLNEDWNPLMHELLEDDTLYEPGWLDRGAVSRLMREHEQGQQNHSHLLWALMLFQLWSARFISRSSSRRP